MGRTLDLDDAFDANGRLTAAFRRKLKKHPTQELIDELTALANTFDEPLRTIAIDSIHDVLFADMPREEAPRGRGAFDDDSFFTPMAAPDDFGDNFDPVSAELSLDAIDAPVLMGGPAPAIPMAAPAAEAQAELPRSFFALAEGPAHVPAQVEFSITAGITKTAPTPGAKPFELPAGKTGEYDIEMKVQADGFTFRDDNSTFKLHVTHADPYPTTDIFLTADVVADRTDRTISIFYTVDGQVLGSGDLKVTVHIDEDEETENAQRETWKRVFSAPTAKVPPDLTVMITERDGRFEWSFITPLPNVVVPIKPVRVETQSRPRAFAETVLKSANALEGSDTLFIDLLGLGKKISDIIDKNFWGVLKQVIAAKKGETPSLLIISNEPYIPWELAILPKAMKKPHPDLAPFLGVQLRVGRWINGNRLPPPHAHAIQRASVVSGIYARPRWNRLKNAEEEAAAIAQSYNATSIDATLANIVGLFDIDPPADLLHFSMHGQSAEDSLEDGLVPIDKGFVKSDMITGAIERSALKIAPFVFLNACQVGAGSRLLGDYGGMAEAFISGGAAGVVAPLWSIKDDLAKQIAIDFYRATLEEKLAPAEAIRRARANFVSAKNPVSATYLAYQFFGHPSLQLDGSALQKKDN